MRAHALGLIGGTAAIIVACSGKAVVDPPGPSSSGTGGTTSSGTTSTTSSGTTSSTTSTSGTGGSALDCDGLEAELEAAWLAARVCDPAIDVAQCTGELIVLDQCGCEWAANVFTPDKADAAVAAYDKWVDFGCGPWDCAWCPVPLPASCEAGPNGNTGTCVPQTN